MLHSHLDVNPIKIVEESTHRCGFEAYRLLSRAYSRYTPETEVALLNIIVQMRRWPVKGIKQAEPVMREAKARISIWQKRTKTVESEQEPGTMIVICTLLLFKFDPEVRKDVLNAASRDDSQHGPTRVLAVFEYVKVMVENVKRIDDQNKPVPMDLGSFTEIHDHATYVQWNDDGAPDWSENGFECSQDCAEYQEAPHAEAGVQQLAAIRELEGQLDALRKGKGKGKGKDNNG